MSPKKKRRLAFALAALAAGAGSGALVIAALDENVLYFYGPSDLQSRPVAPGKQFRIGGVVQNGSLKHGSGAEVRFAVTDGRASVPVRYTGALPDLFREGQGVVALGARGDDGVFVATQVLAKHDERYMPREVVDALKRAGRWKEGETLTGEGPPARPKPLRRGGGP
ncbi:MAG: cytochrome c maturation protein CcmE [Alphaproteobacteria bacterium]